MNETPNAIEVLKKQMEDDYFKNHQPQQTEKQFLEERLEEVLKEIYQTRQRNAEQAKQQIRSIGKSD